MFAIATGLMLAIVILALSYPFWRRTQTPVPSSDSSAEDQERIDLEIEKQVILTSLSELDIDLAQGRLTEKDYQRLKATDEHRLLQILNKLDQPTKEGRPPRTKGAKPQPQSSPVLHWTSSALLGLLIVGSSSAIYYYLHWRQDAELRAVQGQADGPGMPDPKEMVARLEARLRANPNDLQGQIMAGRSYLALQRIDDAKKAWSKVLELDPKNYEAHFNLGVILLQTRKIDDPKIFEEALDHFDTALVMVPMEPAVLWWKGVALVHLKRYNEAEACWTTAFQNLPPDSEDAKFVKQALQSLRTGKPPLF
jgi:cytochrome c-type biogenesis protein CcmH